MSALYPRHAFQPYRAQFSQPKRPSLLARFRHGASAMAERVRLRRELYGMSPKELQDIGITRGDIERVLSPAFAREYANRGDLRRR